MNKAFKMEFITKRVILLIGLLACNTFSSEAFAAVITHNGYSLDTSKKIVSKGRLEWLQWSETRGEVSRYAVRDYAPQGWRLATNIELANLFSDFGWESTSDETKSAENILTFPLENTPSYASMFIKLFGYTYLRSSGTTDIFHTRAYFGSDINNNGFFNFVSIKQEAQADFYNYSVKYDGFANIYAESAAYSDLRGSGLAGVALVREKEISVPEPKAFWLFILCLPLLKLKVTRLMKTNPTREEI